MLATFLMYVSNAEASVEGAIKSVLGQTERDLRLIVIDDASTDKSLEIIDSFSDKRIDILHLYEYEGIATALNKGVKLADTPYILRADAGEESVPARLHLQLDFMDKYPEIGVSSSYLQRFAAQKIAWQYPLSHEAICAQMVFSNGMSANTSIYRTDLLKRNLYSENFPGMEDYDLNFRLMNQTRFANIPEVLSTNQGAGKSIKQVHFSESREVAARFFKEKLESLGFNPTHEELQLQLDLHFIYNTDTFQQPREYMDWLNMLRTHPEFPLNTEAFEEIVEIRWKLLARRIMPYNFSDALRFLGASKHISGDMWRYAAWALMGLH